MTSPQIVSSQGEVFARDNVADSYFLLNKRGAMKLCWQAISQCQKLDFPFGAGHKTAADGYFDAKATHMLLFIEKNRIKGKIEFNGPSEEERACSLRWICAPKFGTKLHAKFEELMRKQGATSIELRYVATDTFNIAEQKRVHVLAAFYYGLGYKETETVTTRIEIPFMPITNRDVHMRKELPPNQVE